MAFPLPQIEAGDWASFGPVWQLVAMLTGAMAGFIAGAILGGKVDWLRRLFTSRAQMRDEVYSRAREVFFDKRVHHTDHGSGVLLYVSMFEHMAAVIADELCRDFTQRLHEKAPIDALCDTATSLGRHLAPLLPRAENDVNELSDALVVID
jgi:putative membrane protein